MLAQLGVIPIIRNNFVEIVAVSEHYLIPNHVKNKESKKNPVKLSNGKILMKKEKKKKSSYLIYNIVSLGKMAGKPSS